MSKKKHKPNSRQRRNNRQVAVRPEAGHVVTASQMAQIRDMRSQLEAELETIRNSPAPCPPPPARHVYKREIRKDDFEHPELAWVLVSCENCEFIVYARAGELHQKVEQVSPYCALPFGTAKEAERLMKNWEDAVAQAYSEMFDDSKP